MKKRRVLNIISESYPYGNGEQFFDVEVKELAKKFDQVVLYPLSTKNDKRKLPNNVSINAAIAHSKRKKAGKIKYLINSVLLIRVIVIELRKSKQKRYILSQLKVLVSRIIQCAELAKQFNETINHSDRNYYYSFWMNDGALLLSILKSQNKIDKFFFRVNGFDIFNERHEGNYLPFRRFNYKHVKNVLVLSSGALNYLKNLKIYPEKLKLAHYGIYQMGLNSLDENTEVTKIVSCSNLIPLKRVDKIIDALALIQGKKIEWVHFGDGVLMDELKNQAANKLTNKISFHFKGSVSNQEILKLYDEQSINLFIHTSETEGLGMSIIEAQCYGIPAVVIGVGGVPDIVTNETGRILNENASVEHISQAIIEVLNSDLNSNAKRKEIQSKCLTVFDAQNNYQLIANLLTE